MEIITQRIILNICTKTKEGSKTLKQMKSVRDRRTTLSWFVLWHIGLAHWSIQQVNQHQAQLVLGWVTIRGQENHLSM